MACALTSARMVVASAASGLTAGNRQSTPKRETTRFTVKHLSTLYCLTKGHDDRITFTLSLAKPNLFFTSHQFVAIILLELCACGGVSDGFVSNFTLVLPNIRGHDVGREFSIE